MRMIDADKLDEDILYWNMHNDPKQKDYDTRDIEDVLREQPTVEAIPVEWIEKRMEHWVEYGDQYITITEMLEDWRKENE